METVFKEIRTAFNELNSPTSPAWTTLSSGYFDFRDKIDEVNNYLSDFGLGRPIPVNQILDMTLHGIVTPDIPAVEVCIIRCVTIIPSINIPDIPGMCSYTPVLRDTAICTRGNGADKLRSQFAVPAVKDAVEDAGVEVPSGVTVAKLVSTFAQLEPTTPPAGARTLAATSGTRIDCAVSQVSYPASTIGDTFFDVNTMGTTVTVQGDSPGELGKDGEASTATVDDAQQGTLDALLTTSADGGCGDTVPSNEPAKTLTLALDKSVVTEASSLTATGTATNGHAGDLVTLDWGDGSSSTLEVANDLTWRGTHTYADDAGPGTSTTYLVEASADGYDGASRSVAVVNVVPLVVDLSATPTSVGETELATLTGRITDPGTRDTHTVTVDWGDGTAAEDVTVTNRAFTATHRYADDNPSGTASDAVTISVGVVDKDGGSSEATTSQTVVNRDPGEVTLGFPAALVDGENTFTRTGADRDAHRHRQGHLGRRHPAGRDQLGRRHDRHADAGQRRHHDPPDLLRPRLGEGLPLPGRRGRHRRRPRQRHDGTALGRRHPGHGRQGGRHRLVDQRDEEPRRRAPRRHHHRRRELLPGHRPAREQHVRRGRAARHHRPGVRRAQAGGGGGAKLAAEREKLDRELLAALLDFAHGRVAWDTPVATGTDVGKVTFGRLVKLADQARAGTSVDRVMTLRQALGAV